MPKSGLCATRGYSTSDSMGRILAAATLMAISMINAAPLMPENALMPEKALSGKIDELVAKGKARKQSGGSCDKPWDTWCTEAQGHGFTYYTDLDCDGELSAAQTIAPRSTDRAFESRSDR